jgi:hypothetical protein
MRWLDEGQSAMMAALDHGPAHLPGGLFAGSPEQVLAGMKVHANTISHARLVALEDTFPRTREAIGHDSFNALSRLFINEPGVAAQPLAAIGSGFDGFLIAAGENHGVADLARFEWLWLQSYHAADAESLMLGELAGLAPEALLEQVLVCHPAAIAARFAPLVHDLIGAEVPGLGEAETILITRPQAEVLVAPANDLMNRVFALAEKPRTIGNLLALASEVQGDEAELVDAAMQALVALINVGALIRAD